MRALILAAALLSGCDQPPGSPWHGVGCEQTTPMQPSAPPSALDVVLVVSDAPSMARHRDALIAGLADMVGRYDWLQGGVPSLRVTVVDAHGNYGAEPQVPGCVAPDQRFVEDLALPWFRCTDDDPDGCRARNYPGALTDVVPCVGAIAADGAGPSPLLARLDRALDDDSVLRPGSFAVVVLITVEDDASSGTAAAYARRLREARADPVRLMVSVIGRPGQPRLEALLQEFPNRNAWTSFDGDEWGSALLGFDGWFPGRVNACLDLDALVDLEPQTAGRQLDCVAEDRDGTRILPCTMAAPDRPDPATPLPCYWLDDRVWDDDACDRFAIVEREQGWEHAALRCACIPD